MENDYLDKVSGMIENKRAKELIIDELAGHILDKAEYYEELGYSRDEAMERATEDMGSAEDAAEPLNALHSVKWYKNKLNIISLILLSLIIFLCTVFTEKFCYTTEPYAAIFVKSFWVGEEPYLVIHRVGIDFLSFAVFAAFILMLYWARKHKNLFIASAVCVALVIPIVLCVTENVLFYTYPDLPSTYNLPDMHFSSWFEPMLFAIFTIVKSGVTGYIDSIFSYSYTYTYLESCATALISAALFAILLAWSVLLVISIYRQQRAIPNKKISRVFKPCERAVSIFLAVNTVLMLPCTIVACVNLDEKIEESRAQRKAAYDYIINADMTLSKAEQLERLKENGYELLPLDFDFFHQSDGTMSITYDDDYYNYYVLNQNNAFFSLWYYDYDYENYYTYDLEYSVNTVYEDNVALNDGLFFEASDFDFVRIGMSLDEFLAAGIYENAASTLKSRDISGDDYIQFSFAGVDDYGDIGEFYMKFCNNELVEYEPYINTPVVTEEYYERDQRFKAFNDSLTNIN